MTEIVQLLRELEWSSIRRGPGSGPHGSGGDGQAFKSCPMCGGIAPDQRGADMNFVASAIGHKEACRLHAAAASLEAQEPVEYWVLYDATAEKKYIKKSAGDGSLAFFDTEGDAKRAQRRHGDSVGYMRVEYYRHPPTSAVPEGYALVPEKATPEMLAEIHLIEHFSEQALQTRYAAMLAAAPQQGGGE